MNNLPFFHHLGKDKYTVLEVFDREGDKNKPLAYVLVEREINWTEHADSNELKSASLTMHYRELGLSELDTKHAFNGGYTALHKTVSIASSKGYDSNGVFFDLAKLRGNRVGTYLMSEIVSFVKSWPSSNVFPITLSAVHGDDENLCRRNRFYEKFGIAFDFDDETKRSGRSKAIKASSLIVNKSWQLNIKEHGIESFLNQQAYLVKTLNSSVNELTRENKALKTALKEHRNYPIKTFLKHMITMLSSISSWHVFVLLSSLSALLFVGIC